MSDRFSRNSTIIQANRLDRLEIYGLGGIGSVLVMQAGIMGFPFVFGMDADRFELHNSSTSSYPISWAGAFKTTCADELFRMFSDDLEQDCNFKNIFWDDTMPVGKAILCAVDDMQVRKSLYEAWKKLPDRLFFIDVRMGAFSHEVITVTKNNDFYMETWKPDEDIEDEVCTARHTIFTAFDSSASVMSQVQKLLAGNPYHAYLWNGLDVNKTEKEHFIPDENIFSEEQGEETPAVRSEATCQSVTT